MQIVGRGRTALFFLMLRVGIALICSGTAAHAPSNQGAGFGHLFNSARQALQRKTQR